MAQFRPDQKLPIRQNRDKAKLKSGEIKHDFRILVLLLFQRLGSLLKSISTLRLIYLGHSSPSIFTFLCLCVLSPQTFHWDSLILISTNRNKTPDQRLDARLAKIQVAFVDKLNFHVVLVGKT